MLLSRTNDLLAAKEQKAGLTPETLAALLRNTGMQTASGLAVTPERAMEIVVR